ncbi:MAG: hypothetical protein CME31_08660 [Gimesia sp.]|nr:hypothetical protein [Gimesia sp.]|tara:strand:- start:193 stop:459 length:267 start_codon:yes stop_codon:yes gene_type:complete
MHITMFDDETLLVDAESYFYLWCCDCNLRHLVVVEAVGKGADKFKSEDGKIAIAMARDSKATEIARKRDKIVLYQRKDRKKDVETKKA